MSAGLYESAPPAWRGLLEALGHSRTPDGKPGLRDVDAPCEHYEPVEMAREAEGHGDCDTDGHYLCAEGQIVCHHISAQALAHRRDPERA